MRAIIIALPFLLFCFFSVHSYAQALLPLTEQTSKEQSQQYFQDKLKDAECGNIEAQHRVAYLYLSGKGTPRNVNKAIEWYKISANHGYVLSQHALAIIYNTANGVPQNYNEGFKWAKKAAENGFYEAFGMISVMYAAGHGTEIDLVKAYAWDSLCGEYKDEKLIEYRNKLIAHMTTNQIAEAEELAKTYFKMFAKQSKNKD